MRVAAAKLTKSKASGSFLKFLGRNSLRQLSPSRGQNWRCPQLYLRWPLRFQLRAWGTGKYFSDFLLVFFLAVLRGIQDLNSPTRHRTCVPCSGTEFRVLTTGLWDHWEAIQWLLGSCGGHSGSSAAGFCIAPPHHPLRYLEAMGGGQLGLGGSQFFTPAGRSCPDLTGLACSSGQGDRGGPSLGARSSEVDAGGTSKGLCLPRWGWRLSPWPNLTRAPLSLLWPWTLVSLLVGPVLPSFNKNPAKSA